MHPVEVQGTPHVAWSCAPKIEFRATAAGCKAPPWGRLHGRVQTVRMCALRFVHMCHMCIGMCASMHVTVCQCVMHVGAQAYVRPCHSQWSATPRGLLNAHRESESPGPNQIAKSLTLGRHRAASVLHAAKLAVEQRLAQA